MSLNLITPVFHEKNFFDEKGTLHQEKQIIKGRFIYIIDKFTKDKPDSVSEYYANSKGKLCRWDNSINDWIIIPIKQGKYYFYVTDNNIPLSENERKEIKQEWCSEKDISSDFEQEICLENKKILITLYEKNYFDKDSEKFISEQIVKNKYAYLVENFDEEFEKNIKKFFINSDGHFCDDNKNVCLFFSNSYYIYITFDKKEINENNQFFFNEEVFQKFELKNEKRQNITITWQAEFIRQKILQKGIKNDNWKKNKPNYPGNNFHFDYTKIAIHHSGNGSTNTLEKIEKDHYKKYDDIAYHYIIDKNGKIFEGIRVYFKGTHISQNNSNKIGILLIGDFEPQIYDFNDDIPSPAQIYSLYFLISLLKNYFHIYELGGHKDWAIKDKKDCTCPGKILYELLPEIRNKHDLKNPSNEKY